VGIHVAVGLERNKNDPFVALMLPLGLTEVSHWYRRHQPGAGEDVMANLQRADLHG
jgi:hypothetical protein